MKNKLTKKESQELQERNRYNNLLISDVLKNPRHAIIPNR